MQASPPNYYHLPKQETKLSRDVQTVATFIVMLDGQSDSDGRMSHFFFPSVSLKFYLDPETQTEFRHNLTHTE